MKIDSKARVEDKEEKIKLKETCQRQRDEDRLIKLK